MFDRATVKLAAGRTLVITRKGNGIYVRDVRFNGAEFPTDWLPIAKLHPGLNRLEFLNQPQPDTTRATKPQDRPPSFR
jgi:putative alpha-1,2-mannosidase